MKKLISLLMILAVLLSLCACGGQTNEPTNEPAVDPTEATTEGSGLLVPEVKPSKEYTPEELYGHIDQTKPNSDGVYKIWSKDGVANMANVPDGTFELLCNVDMEGAALQPIGTTEKPFTGKIDGKNFIISNFTLASEGEALGFVGVNEGTVQDLQLEGVTATAGAANKYIGTMAGSNKSVILRSKSSGTLTVDAAAADAVIGGAVGQNTGDFTNTTITVDVLVNTSEAATVGGIVGTTNGGKVEFIESYGAITVTGENKTVGLFAGASENTPITKCVFVGADNSLNGELFTNLTNTADESLITGCAMRDNTPVYISPESQKLRDIVVERFNEFGTIEWKVDKTLEHESGVWSVGTTYYGSPYKHQGASISSLKYMIGEDGYLKDFVYEMDPLGLQGYMGTDCSTGLATAWYAVSDSISFTHCHNMYPWMDCGGLYVGDWEPDPGLSTSDSYKHIEYNGEEKIYECYAQLKKGDAYVYHIPKVGGHTRMAAANAVVVRDQNGKIDPNYSYVTTTEQGWTTSDSENHTHTTCRVEHNYTFANLIYDGALPLTCEEMVTGEMEPATAEITGTAEGKLGMITGVIQTNYYLDYVRLAITDSKGNEVFNHIMFPVISRDNDCSETECRGPIKKFDMGRFATPLSGVIFEIGETYSYTITAYDIPGNVFEVRADSFTYGSAE